MSDIILDNAEKVVAAFGGIRPMAKKLGVAVTTVQGWKERGTIPIARLDDIKEAARREGIDLMAVVTSDTPVATGDAPAAAPMEGGKDDGAPPTATRTAGSVPPSRAKSPDGPGSDTPRSENARPGTNPGDAKSENTGQSAEAARAEKVRPVSDTGITAAETADDETVIEEEILEYEDRGWKVRTAMFGIGFGFAAVLGFVAAWYLGAFDQTASLSDKDRAAWEARFAAENKARSAMQTQLAKVERELAATTKALATANATLAELRKGGGDPAKLIEGLRAQVTELTKRVDALPTTTGATGAIAKLADRVNALEKRLAAGGGTGTQALAKENKQLKEDLSSAEKRLVALETRIGRLTPGGGYGALVIAIGQLRDTALGGRPYKSELARVQALANDYPDVVKLTASLASTAEEGIASRAALIERFGPASTAMLRAAARDVEGDWVDRAWGRVKSMVTVRRTGRDVEGETPGALVTRAENALRDGKLGEALALIGRLPAKSQEAGARWITAAKARLAAETALDRMQTAVLKMVTGANQ